MHTTERPTNADELDVANPTIEPTSRSRQAGIEWYERLISQSRECAADSTRFMAGLQTEE